MTTPIEKIRAAIPQYQQKFLEGLQQIMQIPSVKSEAADYAPFGIENKRVLETTLKLAESLGFKTGMVDNAVGYVQYGDNDSEYIGILGHLDVVAAGTGWDYPPFDLTEHDGILYGRGILDNKGPIISTLYALYILKELELVLPKTIRIIFGTDEESGMHDIPLYLLKEPPPMYGFTPDCKFPAVYGERGMVTYRFTTPRNTSNTGELYLKDVTGDFTRSSVPDHLLAAFSNKTTQEIHGKRAPSNAPEMGENVITKLADTLQYHDTLSASDREYFSWLARSFHNHHFGEGLSIHFSDEDSGTLQLTPYTFEVHDNEFLLEVSIRYPISVSEEEITQTIEQHLPHNSELEVIRRFPRKLFPKDHPMIHVMQDIYELCTDMDGTPVTTTGATYARTMPNTIAFGPSFPGQKGIAHNANEYMVLSDLMLNMEVYALTIFRLTQLS